MGKWIHRGLALALFVPYVIAAPCGRDFLGWGWGVWWFLVCFGLFLVLFAEPLDDRLGSTTGASYVPMVRLMGWTFLAAPPAWDLIVWGLMRT